MGQSLGQDLDPRHRRAERERLHPGRQDRRAGERRLRIAFLDSWTSEPARGSGTAVSISGLARGLQSLGHGVTRIGPRGGSKQETIGLLRRVAFNLALPTRLDPRAYDLIVGFDLDGFFLSRDQSVPLVVCLKGVAADEAVFERGRARANRLVAAALEGRNAASASLVVVPSRHSARAAQRAYGLDSRKLSVIPEGIELEPWTELRESFPRPAWERAPVILNVARQYPRKNTRTLLSAMPRVLEAVPGARLRIVGGGPELPALKRLAREVVGGGVVSFLGALESLEAVRREYMTAACFCLPSRQEGFGIVLLEAMAAGLPIVAGRAGAVPEVVPHETAGLLTDPLDPEALARALVKVLTLPDLARRLATEGERRVAAYDLPLVARRFIDEVRRWEDTSWT